MEEWRAVPGFPYYQVSDQGRVRSWKGAQVRVLKSGPCGQAGYRMVCLRRDGKTHAHRVHRLVLETFVGPPPEGMECHHINNLKDDNRLENLQWVSRADNMNEMLDSGRGRNQAGPIRRIRG